MTQPKKDKPARSEWWATLKDRLGIAAVLIVLLLLFFMMFTDASFNFQCSVTDFVMMKCNRFNREFKRWEPDKKPADSSFVPSIKYRGVRLAAIRMKACAVA